MRALVVALALVAAGAGAAPPTVLDLKVVRGDGTVATLRDVVRDDAAVVAFWATYCAPCRAEVPALNRAVARWRGAGLRVLGVDVETDAPRMREARDEWGMRYDVLPIAPDQDALRDVLFPRGLPSAAFVARGEATLHDRILDDATLDRLVPPLLAPAPSQ